MHTKNFIYIVLINPPRKPLGHSIVIIPISYMGKLRQSSFLSSLKVTRIQLMKGAAGTLAPESELLPTPPHHFLQIREVLTCGNEKQLVLY